VPLFQNATFFTTVNELHCLPAPVGVEIAFAGRSNAGKSSALNTLANRRKLAFVSKTPGRTQHINYFQLASDKYLVDLPGYGYAKVPRDIRQHWEGLLSEYLQTRESLQGLVLIMDIRHPLTPLDVQMLVWFATTGKPIHILLTKADKLSRTEANKVLLVVREKLQETYPQCTVQLFSSLAKQGVEEAEKVLGGWLGIEKKAPQKKPLAASPNSVSKSPHKHG